MNVLLNGKTEVLNGPLTLTRLLEQKEIDPSYMAVAINCEFVPKSEYDKVQIKNGDDIEIVTPHPGG